MPCYTTPRLAVGFVGNASEPDITQIMIIEKKIDFLNYLYKLKMNFLPRKSSNANE